MDSPAKTALVYLWAPFGNLLWYVETVVMGTISLLVWPFDGTAIDGKVARAPQVASRDSLAVSLLKGDLP